LPQGLKADLALYGCLALIVYLLKVDKTQTKDASPALFIPLAWIFFASTRFFSRWLVILGLPVPSGGAEGSPLDRVLFLLLIVAGLWVLYSRRASWPRILLHNKWIWLFFAFGLVSVLWSVDPGASLKRVPKAMGNVVIALVILSDERPMAALGTVLRRLAYLTLPLSVVFIKFFPALGRVYGFSGAVQLTGISTQKNSLGELCLFAGIYCVWSLMYRPGQPVLFVGRLRVEWVVLALSIYLMKLSNSMTAFACLMVALIILFFGRQNWIRTPRRVSIAVVVVAVVLGTLESAFGVSATIIEALGRDSDLTHRVPLWQSLLATNNFDPLVGAGYEAFWLTPAAVDIAQEFRIGNAHNGYLDTYLSSGYIGLAIWLGAIFAAVPKIARQPGSDYASAIVRLSLLMVVVLYNWTESAFSGVSTVWTMFFVAGLDPRIRKEAWRQSVTALTPQRTEPTARAQGQAVPVSHFLVRRRHALASEAHAHRSRTSRKGQ
jgi:exopolysaccharide production protein ExoQ